MPKPLFDECVSILFKDDSKLRMSGLRVVDLLGAGTKDPDVELYAERRNMRIVTMDRGLIYRQLKKKPHQIGFVNKKTGEIFALKAKKIGKLEPRHDPVTHYMKFDTTKRDVIRP
jgi:hypothetical protein